MNKRDYKKKLISKMQFLGQMASTETALFHQVAAAKLGLGITDMKTISTLLQEGPMSAGQLSQRLNLTTGAVTNVINRLKKRNFLISKPDAKDHRKTIVTINQERFTVTEPIYKSMGEAFEKLLSTYSIQELEFLVQFYQASIALTKKETKKLNS